MGWMDEILSSQSATPMQGNEGKYKGPTAIIRDQMTPEAWAAAQARNYVYDAGEQGIVDQTPHFFNTTDEYNTHMANKSDFTSKYLAPAMAAAIGGGMLGFGTGALGGASGGGAAAVPGAGYVAGEGLGVAGTAGLAATPGVTGAAAIPAAAAGASTMNPWVAGGLTALNTIGGMYSSNKAADAQSDAAKSAADLQYKMFQEGNALQKPWLDAGESALNKLAPLVENYTPFGETDWKQDPGYAFRLSEGMKALERQGAVRSGNISGAALKNAQRFGQEMGSQEYTNAFNRYQTERNAQLNPLQSLAGVGQTTAQQISNAGQNYAANAGNLMQQGAQARASGYVGQANAVNNGVNQLSSIMGYNSNPNQYNPYGSPYSNPYGRWG